MTWPILVNMRNRRTRHTTCLSRSAVTCMSITPTNAPSSPRGKESRNAGTRQDDFRMRRTRSHYLGMWFSVFCSFSIPVFRFFSVFTVSGIRSGEGIGSRPAVGCLTRLSVAAADAATLRRAGLFRLMPVFTGFGFSIFRFFGFMGMPIRPGFVPFRRLRAPPVFSGVRRRSAAAGRFPPPSGLSAP